MIGIYRSRDLYLSFALLIAAVLAVPPIGSLSMAVAASTPTPGATATPSGPIRITVPATAGPPAGLGTGLVDTGIKLTPKHPVTITATGKINVCPGCNPSVSWGPNGNGVPPGLHTGCRFPWTAPTTIAAAALLAEIGGGPPRLVGKGPVRLSGSGELLLGINDCYYPDNQGSFTVTITFSTAVAPHLPEAAMITSVRRLAGSLQAAGIRDIALGGESYEISSLGRVPGETLIALGGSTAVLGRVLDRVTSDPYERSFRRIAVSYPPSPPQIRPQQCVSKEASITLNALLVTATQEVGIGRALLHSVLRAKGAARAHDQVWTKRQILSAAAYAAQLADALNREQLLRSRAQTVLGASCLRNFTVTVAGVRQYLRVAAARGLPQPIAQGVRRVGMSLSQMLQVRAVMVRDDPSAIAGSFLQKLAPVAVMGTIHETATVFRTYAARVRAAPLV